MSLEIQLSGILADKNLKTRMWEIFEIQATHKIYSTQKQSQNPILNFL